jgi:hypothetical protein
MGTPGSSLAWGSILTELLWSKDAGGHANSVSLGLPGRPEPAEMGMRAWILAMAVEAGHRASTRCGSPLTRPRASCPAWTTRPGLIWLSCEATRFDKSGPFTIIEDALADRSTRRGSSKVEQGTHKPLVASSNLTLATVTRPSLDPREGFAV